jgi:hypothetical protein
MSHFNYNSLATVHGTSATGAKGLHQTSYNESRDRDSASGCSARGGLPLLGLVAAGSPISDRQRDSTGSR